MLEGRVALITGSGRGIGRAAALLLAGAGARVVVNDLDPEPAEETAALIRASGGQALVSAGDVTAPDFPAEMVARAVETWGDLHILVNNAGYTWSGVLHKTTDQHWQALLDVHLTAPFRLLRAAAPCFRSKGQSIARKVINVSSIAATEGVAGGAGYASAKAGLLGLTKTLAKEWGRYNVQVNALAYGLIETRLSRDREGGREIEREGARITLGLDPEARRLMIQATPLARAGTVEEAAGPILFLASPLSDFVTGQVIVVSGGLQSSPF